MRGRGGWMAGALLLLTNLVVLLGVAFNRSGEPEAVLELTERELPLAYRQNENTGTALRLETGLALSRDWLDQSRLEDLGFDCSAPPHATEAEFHYGKQLPRRGYLVLEYGGEAWTRWLAERSASFESERADPGLKALDVEERRRAFEREKLAQSRLFPIDAGPDPRALRARHPDRSRYLILPAVFAISVDRPWNPATEMPDLPRVQGHVSQLLVQEVHAHRGLARQLEGLRRESEPQFAEDPFREPQAFEPRYSVTLNLGRRHEPWLGEVRLLE